MILSDNKMTTQEVMTEQLTTEWNNNREGNLLRRRRYQTHC